nr:replication initiation protein [Microvirus sp.]
MACEHPYWKRFLPLEMVGLVHSALPLPCGKCLSCRTKSALTWQTRIDIEMLNPMWQDMAFCTLTYDDEHLPKSGKLEYRDFQLFMKRLRKQLDYKVSYFVVGEYGKRNTERPHWHLLLFGLKDSDFAKIKTTWQNGFTDEKVASQGVSKYLTKYITKMVGEVKQFKGKIVIGRSLGLGKWIVDKIPHFTKQIKIGSQTRYLGRYLIQKLRDKFGIVQETFDKLLDFHDSLADFFNQSDDDKVAYAVYYQQRWRELHARQNLRI